MSARSSVAAVGVSTHTAPAKRSASAPSIAVLLGARHRVPADEAGVADGVDDRGLHAADVGDDAPVRWPAPALAASATARTGVARKVISASGSDADGVERAELERPRRDRRIAVVAGDVPAPASERQPDRPTDQPGADHRRPSSTSVGPRASRLRRSPGGSCGGRWSGATPGAVIRAGRRGGRRRLRGTRGAARPGCAPW